MPTPVGAARQCLTQEAAAALDEAVAVARRRGHAQTTSMHMVSSLLSLPSSSLREACTRARNNAYPTRVQFKALELSLSIALDRLPSSQASKSEEPPVSNSLMAAIKRSQANQRRQPENFSFYQQQQQQQFSSCSSVPIVKVELPNLILSILDDPLVSRVFGEAGFRSYDIKTATLRRGNSFHAPHLFGYSSRYRRPNPPSILYNFRSSESINEMRRKGFSFPFLGYDENSIRIGEVMVRNTKRNPLLLGFSSGDSLRIFLETVRMKTDDVLPLGLVGLTIVCIKDDILRFANGDCDERTLEARLEQVQTTVENAIGHGVVVNFGDLQALSGDGVCVDGLRHLVSKLAELLQIHAGKLWLIGAAATLELYYKFLNRFPSVEDDWDLQILPITSPTFSMGGSYPKSSLMESFVPLGGFFSMPTGEKRSSEQDVKALSNGGSVSEHSRFSLPLWLQNAEAGAKAEDDRLLLNSKTSGLQTKWDGICQHRPFVQSFPRGCADPLSFPFPRVAGFQVPENGKEVACKNVISSLPANVQQSSMLSKTNNLSLSSISYEDPMKSECFNASSVCVDKALTSPSSVSSLTIDLGLGVVPDSTSRQPEKPVDQTDPKMLYKFLSERVGHQEAAVCAIVEAVTQRHASRGDIWFNFRGPDRFGKKKLGMALANVLYGTMDSFIYVDLSFRDESNHADRLCHLPAKNKYSSTMRGTAVDYLVEKLSKNPSVVFLENFDKADLVVQNSVFHAVKTGRFMDLSGREVSISNSLFIAATSFLKDSGIGKYSEEEILKAKGGVIQISIGFDLNDENTTTLEGTNYKRKLTSIDESVILDFSKRANKSGTSYLDLNLPADESETCDDKEGKESDSDSSCENSRSWLEEFDGLVDRVVVYEPFDLEKLADQLIKDMTGCLHEIVGSECALEIESNVMQQLLAAAYLLDSQVEDWIRHVLKQGFVEAAGKYNLDACSVVQLVSSESVVSEGQESGLPLLPARIVLS